MGIENKSKPVVPPEPLTLIKGDYYFNEDGLMVFTEQYHLRRGHCCGNGCMHCPFSKKASDLKKE
jgi:hypothetical protein